MRVCARGGGRMSASANEILKLRDAYREARTKIVDNSDPIEREVGLAALRLEATHTYREAVTSQAGLADSALAPLGEYAQALQGGEAAEKAVVQLDAAALRLAKAALANLWAALVGTMLLASGLAVLNVIGFVALQANEIGAALAAALLAGGGASVFIVRGIFYGARGAQDASIKSWDWASGVGVASDQMLGPARALQAELLRRVGGRQVSRRFTAQARLRAQAVVGAMLALAVVAVLLVAAGVVQGVEKKHDEESGIHLPEPQIHLEEPLGE
jgi:hypothetical protein